MEPFRGIIVREKEGEISAGLEELTLNQLSEGDLLIKVEYSTVNYKDMLGFQKNGGVIRNYPMIPGIDLAGRVVSSNDTDFQEGDRVLVISTNVGVTQTGGYAEYARVSSQDVIHTPKNLSSKEAMIFGTAGFTAALSIEALMKHGMTVEKNPNILVTGATGGVGSVALSILSRLGYNNIHALIRKKYQAASAEALGATKIVSDEELKQASGPLSSRKYHYVLDTVGGHVAAQALTQLYDNGSMSMCGNAGGTELNLTVFPMILRGVNILGINSVNYPQNKKEEVWEKLANEWKVTDDLVSKEIRLSDLKETIEALREGKHLGRTIIRIN